MKLGGERLLNNEKFLSICIPSYNRPNELLRLLNSIDASDEKKIEVVIREDNAPKRSEVRHVVDEFRRNTKYTVIYIENEDNFGYDRNIRNVAESATGKWVLFMGDDDVFIKGSLDKYIDFLKHHKSLGYILRRYRSEDFSGKEEEFRYSDRHVFLRPGEKAIIEFFRRSVFISGFTFQKKYFKDYDCFDYDGTLLFQLYIQACICLKYPSAYCDIPITKRIEGGVPFFGKSESEKDLYDSGKNTIQNSINFLGQVKVIAESFDVKNNTNVTKDIMKSYSKYSYGYLIEHREEGAKIFNRYAKELKKIGLGDSFYFDIYYYALLILGKKRCQKLIRMLKIIYKKTPRL